MFLFSMDWQKSVLSWNMNEYAAHSNKPCATSLYWIYNTSVFSFLFICSLILNNSRPSLTGVEVLKSHNTSLSPGLGNVYEWAMWKQQKKSFSNAPSDPTHVEHLQCESCLPDHGMKEACVGQWSLGTLVPVSALVDVSVYLMCLRRQAEKLWKEGLYKWEVKQKFYSRLWWQNCIV